MDKGTIMTSEEQYRKSEGLETRLIKLTKGRGFQPDGTGAMCLNLDDHSCYVSGTKLQIRPKQKEIGRCKTGFALTADTYELYILEMVSQMVPDRANAYCVTSSNGEAVIQYYRLNKEQMNAIRKEISNGKYPITIKASPLTLKERTAKMNAEEERLELERSEAQFYQRMKDEYWEKESYRKANRARWL